MGGYLRKHSSMKDTYQSYEKHLLQQCIPWAQMFSPTDASGECSSNAASVLKGFERHLGLLFRIQIMRLPVGCLDHIVCTRVLFFLVLASRINTEWFVSRYPNLFSHPCTACSDLCVFSHLETLATGQTDRHVPWSSVYCSSFHWGSSTLCRQQVCSCRQLTFWLNFCLDTPPIFV